MGWLVVTGLAALVAIYAGTRTISDLRNRRWVWAVIGACVTVGAPTALAIMAQVMFDYRH